MDDSLPIVGDLVFSDSVMVALNALDIAVFVRIEVGELANENVKD